MLLDIKARRDRMRKNYTNYIKKFFERLSSRELSDLVDKTCRTKR